MVGITGGVFVAEVIGGLLSGSLALLADAGHMLTDSTGLVIALVASALAARPATAARTFGCSVPRCWPRWSTACCWSASLSGCWSGPSNAGMSRSRYPAGLMLAVAVVGVCANLAGLLILRGGKDQSLNLRGAYLEVLGDLLGSIAVIIAAIVITLTGCTRADAIASIAIFVMIIPRAWSLLRDVVDVLLEATPRGVDLDQVRAHITRPRRGRRARPARLDDHQRGPRALRPRRRRRRLHPRRPVR